MIRFREKMAQVNGLLFISLILVGFAILIQVFHSARKSPCLFYWGGLFLFLFIVFPLISNLIFGEALSVKWYVDEKITNSNIYAIYGYGILIFSFCYVAMATSIYTISNPSKQLHNLEPGCSRRERLFLIQNEKWLLYCLGVLVIAGVYCFVLGTGFTLAQLLVASRFSWFKEAARVGSLQVLGFYLISLVALYGYFDLKHRFPNKIFSLLVYLSILFMVVVGGGRKWLFFIASGMIAASYDRYGKVKLNWRLICFALLVVFMGFAWQFGRSVNWAKVQSASDVTDEFIERIPTLFGHGDATYFYRASLEVIRLYEEKGIWHPFALVLRIALLPIPNEFTFGLKPEGLPVLFARDIGCFTAAREGNMPPGLLGLFTVSFGWELGLLLGPLLVLGLVRWLDILIQKNRSPVRNAIFAYFIVFNLLVMRGAEGGIYLLVFGILAATVLWNVILHVRLLLRFVLKSPYAVKAQSPNRGTLSHDNGDFIKNAP